MSFLFGKPKYEIMCEYQKEKSLFDIHDLFHLQLDTPRYTFTQVNPIIVFISMGIQSSFLI